MTQEPLNEGFFPARAKLINNVGPLYCALPFHESGGKAGPRAISYPRPPFEAAKLSRSLHGLERRSKRGGRQSIDLRDEHGDLNNLPERNAAFCKISFVAPFDAPSSPLLPNSLFFSSSCPPRPLCPGKYVLDPSSEHL